MRDVGTKQPRAPQVGRLHLRRVEGDLGHQIFARPWSAWPNTYSTSLSFVGWTAMCRARPRNCLSRLRVTLPVSEHESRLSNRARFRCKTHGSGQSSRRRHELRYTYACNGGRRHERTHLCYLRWLRLQQPGWTRASRNTHADIPHRHVSELYFALFLVLPPPLVEVPTLTS